MIKLCFPLFLLSPQMNQTCKVCGEPAAGFHFGAFTCEGCKVRYVEDMLRRSVHRSPIVHNHHRCNSRERCNSTMLWQTWPNVCAIVITQRRLCLVRQNDLQFGHRDCICLPTSACFFDTIHEA